MTVRKTVLESGLRIVTEEVAGVRSAAFGIWVNVEIDGHSNATLSGPAVLLEDHDLGPFLG